MSIITISRGSYSRGKEVAEKLAAKLGYECISRDIILEASDEFNTPEIKLVRALHNATTTLERFTNGRERYISYIYSGLLQHARKDNMVYHGLSGHFFLRQIPHVLKVRIIADMEDRVREEMRRENLPYDKALYILQKDDEERRKWAMQLYGIDTWDSRVYDIVLRIGSLTVDDAVDILLETVKKPNFKTTEKSQQLVNDLALAAIVKAKLAKNAPKIAVTADSGTIYISNTDTDSESRKEQLETAAMQVEGVREVHFKTGLSNEQHDHVNPFHNIG